MTTSHPSTQSIIASKQLEEIKAQEVKRHGGCSGQRAGRLGRGLGAGRRAVPRSDRVMKLLSQFTTVRHEKSRLYQDLLSLLGSSPVASSSYKAKSASRMMSTGERTDSAAQHQSEEELNSRKQHVDSRKESGEWRHSMDSACENGSGRGSCCGSCFDCC